jgi:hypothetical protein
LIKIDQVVVDLLFLPFVTQQGAPEEERARQQSAIRRRCDCELEWLFVISLRDQVIRDWLAIIGI